MLTVCSADLSPAATSSAAGKTDSAWKNRDAQIDSNDTSGPLAGRTFIAKDLYDIEGHVPGNGNPTWQATHEAASCTAPAVMALVRGGAKLVGTAVMDEMAFSFDGVNEHYGTPRNAAAPGRIPGGSSSGCAAAVAAGEVDIGLGTDTAGSVRVPGSYCGLYAMRPSHERVDLRGAAPMAPSFDTGGLFTRDAGLLRTAALALLRFPRAPFTLRRWLVAADAFDLVDEEAGQAIYKVAASNKSVFESLLGPLNETHVASVTKDDNLARWGSTFSTIQMGEFWAVNGQWITKHRPRFGPGIRERIGQAAEVTQQEVAAALREQMAIRNHVDNLLNWDGVLLLPSTVGPPPPRDSGSDPSVRKRLVALGSIAGLCGLPQVTLPVARLPAGPIGLSIIGPRGADEALLDLAVALSEGLALEDNYR